MKRSVTMAAIIWVLGLIAIILFKDIMITSSLGIILAMVVVGEMTFTTYLVVDGIFKYIDDKESMRDVEQRAFEDKFTEQLQTEVRESEARVNDTIIKIGKIIMKYINR